MNKTFTIRCIALLMMAISLSPFIAYRQRVDKNVPTVFWAEAITVDGDLADWGDSLRLSHEHQGIQYEIRNDRNGIFIAMRVEDKERQLQALSQGFSFMINTEGKKKDGPRLVFPIADRLTYRSVMSGDNENRPDDMREGALASIRSIFVMGFDDIVDGQISLDNQYGIAAKVGLDSTDALCVEAVIPFSRLGLTGQENKSLAFNVKINEVIMRQVAQNNNIRRNPYGYGGYGQNTQMRPREEPGKWTISSLAKQP